MTKKIAVVAAGGKVSRKVITEAVNRGFDVTAFGRNLSRLFTVFTFASDSRSIRP